MARLVVARVSLALGVLVLFAAPTIVADPSEFVITDRAGDQLVPLPSYDLREVRLSGDGENLSVQFKITSLAYDQPRANYNFYFYTEASHPGLPERLACSVGELYPVLFWELGCSLRMTIGQDMDVLNGYRVRTYDAPIDVQYSEGLVLTAIPYAWMSVESGDVLPYVSGQVMACGPTGTCVEVDEAHTSAQYVLP